MRVGIGIGIGYGRAAAFSPAALPGIAAWYTAGPTWCFSDAAGTTTCGNGDLVYVWKDRSGHGFDLVQATSGSRPTLTLSGGKWGVVHDGVASTMTTATATIGIDATTGGSVAAAYNPQATGANTVIIGANNATTFVASLSQRPGPVRAYYRQASNQSSNNYTVGSPNCAIVASNAAGSTYRIRLNAVASTPAISPVNNTAANQITTGKIASEGFFNGTLYEAVLGGADWSDANLLLIEAYYRSAWGTP